MFSFPEYVTPTGLEILSVLVSTKMSLLTELNAGWFWASEELFDAVSEYKEMTGQAPRVFKSKHHKCGSFVESSKKDFQAPW